ncbi:hypothetical protein ACFDTO_32725 [Microbacteriaceae bacterium 4G12]
MKFIESIDPFFMQLVIVPTIVIGLGVLTVIFTRKIWVGPVVTLILNFLYNLWYFKHYYPQNELHITMLFSWCFIFPCISLAISWGVVEVFKQTKKAG